MAKMFTEWLDEYENDVYHMIWLSWSPDLIPMVDFSTNMLHSTLHNHYENTNRRNIFGKNGVPPEQFQGPGALMLR